MYGSFLWIFQYPKFHRKIQKHLRLGQKLVYLGVKSYLKSEPSDLANYKVWGKIKILKFGTKNAWFQCFGVEFENTIVIFETNTPNFSNCKISRTRMPKFGTKYAWSAYFCAGIWNCYCHIWNLHPKICLNSKFPKKMKTLNLGLKMSYLCIFGLES